MLNDPRWVTCDAISFEFKENCRDVSSLLSAAQDIVSSVLGETWRTRTCAGNAFEFDAIYDGSLPLTFADAWQLTHTLEEQESIHYAEPSFTFPIPGETNAPNGDTQLFVQSSGNLDKSGTEDFHWALRQCNVLEAWNLFENSGTKPGKGVIIGHPDSGFVEHSEMDLERVRIDFDKDFLEEDFETRTEKINHGLHGLATASVIMSGSGNGTDAILGPALYAHILPLRVTKPGRIFPAPVLFNGGMRRLRDAVDYAVKKDCKVISISLGGMAHKGLEKALRRAKDNGVIVCAAAGNEVSFVVYPARYKETIAVAGSNCDRGAWKGSCHGDSVDVTAPAESVWRATVSENGESTVNRSNGTSYATALTAGIAALWYSYNLNELGNFTPAEIPDLFRLLLKKTASKNNSLSEGFGAGIVDAKKLLEKDILSIKLERQTNSGEPPVDDILGTHASIGNMPESLKRELISAKSLTAFIGASGLRLSHEEHAVFRFSRTENVHLSTNLTRWLEKNERL